VLVVDSGRFSGGRLIAVPVAELLKDPDFRDAPPWRGGHNEKPLDSEELERWTRVGHGRGMRLRKGER
jgi:hypothetical protein